MKLAFCLFKYFPYGGLQRDFFRIARACATRGHEIHIYTTTWEGETAADWHLHLIPAAGWQNHTRNLSFAKQVQRRLLHDPVDVVVGFNRMPNLDLYYAADVCYQARVLAERSPAYRLLPRYRQMKAMEKSVFARGKSTDIMLIAPKQQTEFERCYQTEAHRFHLLPPGIAKDRIAPPNASAWRLQKRKALKLHADDLLLLMVGSGFKTKGLDRSIAALASLPSALKVRCQLVVIGQDDATLFQQQAERAGVGDRIQFLGGRSDVPEFLLAADALLHPSYHENTGTVLLEAMVAGLPVLTVDACGYAHYISTANAGLVVSSPFTQVKFNQALQTILTSHEREHWQQNGLAFANSADIYSLPEKAADLIETIGSRRATLSRE